MKPITALILLFSFSAEAGREAGGGIVFSIDKEVHIFAQEERGREFIVSEDPLTRSVYQNEIAPQLERLQKVFPPVADYLRVRFEGRKSPRWYFSKFRMKPTNDLGKVDIEIAYKDSEGKLHQLARNNGDEIKISNFDPKVFDPKSEEPFTSYGGWESIKSDESKAWFLFYELIEAEIRKEYRKKDHSYLPSSEKINQIVGLLLSKNLERRYALNGAEFLDELGRLTKGDEVPGLSSLYELTKVSENVPEFKNWKNVSVDRTGPPKSASCRYRHEDCVFKIATYKPIRFTNYWSEAFLTEEAGQDFQFKSYAEVQKTLAAINKQGFGGYSDWRIPSTNELREAFDQGLIELINKVPFFGNLPDSRSISIWTTDIDESAVTTHGYWVWDLLAGKWTSKRFRTDRYGWIFVRNEASELWQDLSTEPDHVTPTKCELNRHECVLNLHREFPNGEVHDEAIAEFSPKEGNPPVSGMHYQGSCNQLNRNGWGGRKNWQDLSHEWALHFAEYGLGRKILELTRFGDASSLVWIGSPFHQEPNSWSGYQLWFRKAFSFATSTAFNVGLEAYGFKGSSKDKFNPWACVSPSK